MNRKIGMISAAVNVVAVLGFAVCMLINFNFGSYFVCMFIAFSFVPLICAFANEAEPKSKTAGYTAMVFAGVYAVLILLVYFAQTTTVQLETLSPQASKILDYQNFGLYFNYDLLGYGLMALSTFFAGLTIKAVTKPDKWLKWLLIIHGVFSLSCFIMPMLGVFKAGSSDTQWVGVAVLEFWCLYFTPVGVLSFLHFKKQAE